jgi:sulfide dehydrogenase cytochrome subunit
MRLIAVAAGSLLAAGSLAASAAAQQIDGRLLALSCLGAIPSISGKSEDFIKNAMMDFRADRRTGTTVMGRLAKGYSDEEIAALSKYIATLK